MSVPVGREPGLQGDPCLMPMEDWSGGGSCAVRSNALWVMVTWGPPVNRQTDTHTTENSIFPQLRRRAVITEHLFGAHIVHWPLWYTASLYSDRVIDLTSTSIYSPNTSELYIWFICLYLERWVHCQELKANVWLIFSPIFVKTCLQGISTRDGSQKNVKFDSCVANCQSSAKIHLAQTQRNFFRSGELHCYPWYLGHKWKK